MSYLELRVLVVLELEWFSSSESDSSVLTDSFRAQPAAEPTPCALFLAGRGREALVPCAESPVPVLAALLAGDHWVAGAGAVSAVLVMMTLLSWLITITVVMLPPLLSSSVSSHKYPVRGFTFHISPSQLWLWSALRAPSQVFCRDSFIMHSLQLCNYVKWSTETFVRGEA